MSDKKYLQLLAKDYPTVEAASSAIINLNAVTQLPKGTEYFFSDLHGEHEAFIHLLRSTSGVIRSKIELLFGKSMLEAERAKLASLIYYPQTQLPRIKAGMDVINTYPAWCEITIYRLVQVCKEVSSKYSRSKVRKTIPHAFSYIIDELLHTEDTGEDKKRYYQEIVSSIIRTGMAEQFITAMCQFIQQMSIDQLHIIGDIFDRGPRADKIMDELMKYHDVDIQWGNHDISWMGAACGSQVCIANVLRIAISYNGFDGLEDGYGINLRALSMFAADVYGEDPCERFMPHLLDENKYDPVDSALAAKMHKAIAIIMFKLEGQLIDRHPEYEMEGRKLLHRIDYEAGTITINGETYPLTDTSFPTVNPDSPYELTEGEAEMMNVISASFRHSNNLRRHMSFIFTHGAMYKSVNGNLLYHGCIPLQEDGSFEILRFPRGNFSGKDLLDFLDTRLRQVYYSSEDSNESDLMWYLWCGSKSPVYGKDRMTTFERYFIDDKSLYTEVMNPYYTFYEEPETCERILSEFGLDPKKSHIINGHVPVKHGENPVKANGKLFVIDGGISKAYQAKTGIAGYTLIYNSHNISLAEHKPFQREKVGTTEDHFTKIHQVEVMEKRISVADTDVGKKLKEKIKDLEDLLKAYREGLISEQ